MPYHYTYVGWEIDTLKQLKKRSITEGKISEEVIQRWNYFNFMRLPHEYDIHKISSAYLIENIDLAFEVWEIDRGVNIIVLKIFVSISSLIG